MECALYFGTAGATANTIVDNIRDVTLDLSVAEADVTTRGNNGWRATVGTLKEGSVEFEMIWDTQDAFFTAVKNAWFNSGSIAALVLDAAKAEGGQGLDADFAVINFQRSEPLEDAVKVSVSLKPTYSTRAPSWYPTGS
jgi:hypothetical protein